jgi:hypothetical protein
MIGARANGDLSSKWPDAQLVPTLRACHSLKTACMLFWLVVHMCIDSRALKLCSPDEEPEHLHASP